MTRDQLSILEEYCDDVSHLCQAILDARMEIDKNREEIERLQDEIKELEQDL